MVASSTEAERGSGRTSRQMRRAPKGAVYIWPHAATLRYARKLARFHDRDDLELLAADWLAENINALSGKTCRVVIDHAATGVLPRRVWDEIALVNQRAARDIKAL